MNISVIYIIETQNLRLGVCLAMCLIFWQFEPGCAYKMCAYKKKSVLRVFKGKLKEGRKIY